LRSLPLYAFVALVFAFLFAPIVVVVLNSFNADASLVHWGGFTTHWYSVAAHNQTVRDSVKTSLEIAVMTTVVATALGTLGAVGLRRAPRALRAASDLTTFGRLIMPELVLAIGLLLVFRAANFPLGITTIVIGHVSLFAAYAVLIVSARLAGRDPATDEAARDLGANAIRAFFRVTLPEILPAVAASGLLIFTFSMDNVVSSLFLSSGVNTLPLTLFSMIRLRVTPEVNAIATVVLALTGIMLALFLALVAGRRAPIDRGTRP
jgi:ABC-type spermidine/putrescine transport system permease subunit II